MNKKYKNVVEMTWDVRKPIKKGQQFKFSWGSMGKRTTGFAKAIEDFRKVKLTKKEAMDIDTYIGVHYYGKAIAHYN